MENWDVYYQKILNLGRNDIFAYEALLRVKGIETADFIEEAEKKGFTHHITRYVLKRACLDFKSVDEGIKLSINISPMELQIDGYWEELHSIMRAGHFDSSRLIIEVTESRFLMDTEVSRINLKMLRECGVKIALDDFGAGYSNLLLLTQQSFDIVKLDKRFLVNILDDVIKRELLERTFKMMKTLRLEVVVEGVENKYVLRLLKDLMVDYVQGFFIDMPKPMEVSSCTACYKRRHLTMVNLKTPELAH